MVSRYTNTVPAIHDKNGLPIVGAKKFFFKPGTTIPKEIYKDSDFIIPQTNPVLSDSVGRFPDIFLDGVYKELQQDNSGTATGFDGVTLWTKDPVGDAPISGEFQPWNPLVTYVITSIVVGLDNNYYKSKTSANLNNDPASNPLMWTRLKFGELWNLTTSYFVGDSVYGDDGYLYIALVDNVGNEPSTSTRWGVNTKGNQFAIATGTSDAITATFNPVIPVFLDGLQVNVRALSANTTTTPTFSPNGLSVKNITKNGNDILDIGDISGADHELILRYNSPNGVWELLNPVTPSNVIIGVSFASISSVLSTTSQISFDPSIPQSSEGIQILSRTYTPKESGTNLYVDVLCNVSGATGDGTIFTAALFDGATSAVSANSNASFSSSITQISVVYVGSYPKGVPITFTVRVGKSSSGTTYINSQSGSARHGGTLNCSIKVTEVN